MTKAVLAKPDALARVLETRATSTFLPRLRAQLAERLQNTRCVVLGSAPRPAIALRRPGDRFLCVNGSGLAARQFGIHEPDLTLVTGYAGSGTSPISKATIEAWKGLRTSDLVLVAAGGGEELIRPLLAEVRFQFDRFTTIDVYERAAIIGEVCGEELGIGPYEERISNGIFVAVLAIWAGASEVVLCWFSLQGGHSYVAGPTPRHHASGDSRFFSLAGKLGAAVTTTSSGIHTAFGIPLERETANLPDGRTGD
jgi:hypothetical protein